MRTNGIIPTTRSPVSTSSPARSQPGTNGGERSGRRRFACPARVPRSVGLIAAARIRTSTSPAPATGSGRSAIWSTPGPPKAVTSATRIFDERVDRAGVGERVAARHVLRLGALEDALDRQLELLA